MATKIIIEVSDEVYDMAGGVDVGLLLRDALADFRAARDGGYVDRRYAGQSESFKQMKIREIAKRIVMTHFIESGTFTIEIEKDEGRRP